jgi:hypothetical protein
MPEKHTILGGKVHVYRRDNSSRWQCSTCLAGKNRRVSTHEDSLAKAKDFAEDWYLQLRGKARAGELRSEKTFRDAAVQFEREFQIITDYQRNATYVKGHGIRSGFISCPSSATWDCPKSRPARSRSTASIAMRKRSRSMESRPARNTMHQETVVLRQTLKTAVRHGWLDRLPDLSEPYRASGKISHRGWFSPEEYKKLYTARASGRATRRTPATSGNQSSFTTTYCSWRIPACVRTRRTASNTAI